MKTFVRTCLTLVLLGAAAAQAMPVGDLIGAVAAKTGKKFVLDPKVQGEVTLVGQNASSVTLPELTNILRVYGFTVLEGGGYVRVVPDAMARTLPVPTIDSKERRADGEIVSRVIRVKSLSAAQLVPILRPIVPQYGHMVAYPCANLLMLVDTYANVRRIEALVESMDVGPPVTLEGCATAAK